MTNDLPLMLFYFATTYNKVLKVTVFIFFFKQKEILLGIFNSKIATTSNVAQVIKENLSKV